MSWLIEKMGVLKSAHETVDLLKKTPDSDGVVFVPAFTGLHSAR